MLTTAQGKAAVAPISTGPCLQHRCPWQEQEQPCAAFGAWLEEGQGNSCPTFTPMNQSCVQILFSFTWHQNGLNLTSVQALHGVKALTGSSPGGDGMKVVKHHPTPGQCHHKPWEGSALQQLGHHGLQQHQCPLPCWLHCPVSPHQGPPCPLPPSKDTSERKKPTEELFA